MAPSLPPRLEPASAQTGRSVASCVLASLLPLIAPPAASAAPQTGPTLAASLGAPAPQAGARFGEAVAVTAERLVVGAPGADGVAPRSGAVHVWRADPATATPTFEATLLPSSGSTGERFGAALAADGALLSAAAPGVAVFVFERDAAGSWRELQRLAPEAPGAELFGWDLALDGQRLLVGSPAADGEAGLARLFERAGPGTGFVPVATLRLAAPVPGARLGARVALSGPLAALSAPGWSPPDASSTTPVGAAFLWSLAGAPALLQPLAPGYGGPVEEFGADLDLEGSTVVVGAPGKLVAGLNGAGAALVLEPRGPAATFVVVRELLAPDLAADDGFGRAVSLSGEVILVGAPDTPEGGAVYAFGRDAGGPGAWSALGQLDNPSGLGDLFGQALDHRGPLGLAGAPAADAGTLGGAGAAAVLAGSKRHGVVRGARFAVEPGGQGTGRRVPRRGRDGRVRADRSMGR